jgi:hypothetical protein
MTITTPSKNTQSINRIFLGLSRPPLLSAIEWFLDEYRSSRPGSPSGVWNLENLIVVLPTSRSKARLKQLLTLKAAQLDLSYTPPAVTTLGELPECLYAAQKTLASELIQQIAWAKALSETDDNEYRQLTGRSSEERPDDWQPLASMIGKLHTRLSADIWSFRSVAREVARQSGFLKQELSRWEVLQAIQGRYYRVLEEVNLWDKQAARNYAAAGMLKANEIRCRTKKTIIMLATADLTRSVSEMLRQVAAVNPDQVKILIAAKPELADHFDEFGSLITEKWLNLPIPIPDEKIRIVDQPSDQAFAAGYYLSQLNDVATDEVTLGVPDESVLPQLERTLNALELPHRWLAGRRLIETAPVKLISACADYLREFRFDSLTSLVRHPDLFQWLAERVQSDSWLTDLDSFQNSNLPDSIDLNQNDPFGNPDEIRQQFDPTDLADKLRASKLANAIDRLNRIFCELQGLLKPMLADWQPIGNWAEPWRQLLLTIYGNRKLNKANFFDRQIILACQTIFEALEDQLHVPVKLQAKVSAIQGLDWALKAAAEKRVIPPENPLAVELAGWLDLTLDDAPVLVLTGMNDEFVPTSERGHPFLPNELCKQLNILDNDRRFARDCYALTVITSVRQKYQLILGRRDEGGEPLKPSRLLFTEQPQVSAKRAKAFFSYAGKAAPQYWLGTAANVLPVQGLPIPKPQLIKPVEQLTVTRFRDYLKCPYRFYLKHLLRLENMSDDLRELDAGMFGDLIHNCLEAFGKNPIRDSQSPPLIEEFLNAQLNEYVAQQYPGAKLPAVKMQIEQIRLRFKKFAEIQAEQRSKGWRIVSTEESLEHEIDVDGKPFRIRGKIDRIDQHEITGQVAVWDYKSSDKGEGPAEAHYMPRKGEWKDLQLPLYRYLLEEVETLKGTDLSNVITGYLLLPKRLEDIRFEATDWKQEMYEDAAETARGVIRQIRQSIFWPPNPHPPLYSEEFASICQDNVFEPFPVESQP